MNSRLSTRAALACCCILGLLAAMPAGQGSAPMPAQLGLLQLRKDFHLAGTLGDSELMRSLWTDDAVFVGGGQQITGADNIVAFFEMQDPWGESVTLTSESKAHFEVLGNTAYYEFECIIVTVDGGDPLETSLSSLPPGSQNPQVEILQHSNTSGMAVREDGRWKFATFNGAGGPL